MKDELNFFHNGGGDSYILKSSMEITRSPLPQNNDNLSLPFFCGNYPIVLLDNIY